MSPLPEVLIVDDDRMMRVMLREALADVPCTITEAESGDAALTIITERQPAVVLLDLIMPGRSGLDVLRALKTAAARPSSRILVMTALDSEPLVQQAMSDGAFGFLTKPLHRLDVANMVRGALEASVAETGDKTGGHS
jgi:two-component system, chemotaxis family, chemotaxis protein CheY